MNTEKAVIANPVVFTDKYKPSELKFRQQHIEKMLFCLQNGHEQVNLFLFGPSGCGKSAVIREVLARIGKDTVTVNCFEARTLQAVLEQIIAELRISKGLRGFDPGTAFRPDVKSILRFGLHPSAKDFFIMSFFQSLAAYWLWIPLSRF